MAIGPVDQIRSMSPWNGAAPSQPWDVLQADAILQFTPWRHMVFDAWSAGQRPFWNPHQLMGTPLLANSQSAGFYPLHILMGVLRMPVYPAMALLAWFHLFIAGLGVYRLGGKLGATQAGSAVAGISFSMSAFMLSWTALPSVITTVAWIPWVLTSTLGIFQASAYWGIFAPQPSHVEAQDMETAVGEVEALPKLRVRSVLGLAASTAMLLLGGHLQFAAFGLLAAGLFTLVLCLYQAGILGWHGKGLLPVPAGISAMLCAIGLCLGFLVASPQVLPVLAFSKHAHRIGSATTEGYAAYSGGAIQGFELAGVIFPTVLGHPLESSEVIPGATGFWPAYAKQGGNFAESALGIGPLVFLLLWLVPRRRWARPESAALACVGVLGLCIALGTPLNRLLYFWLPGWSATASPGRAGVLFVMSACTLASLGITRGARSNIPIVRIALPAVIAALTCALPFYMAAGTPDPYHLGSALGRISGEALSRSAGPIAFALALSIVAVLARVRAYGGIFLGCCALAVATSSLNFHSPVPTGSPLLTPPRSPQGRMAAVNSDWQLLVREQAMWPPNTASLFGFNDIAGYDSLLDKDTKALLDAANGQDSAPPANGNMLFVKPGASVERLSDLGVEEIWSKTPIPGIESRYERSFYVYKTESHGRFDNGGRHVSLVTDGYDRLVVRADGPGILTVRDRNTEGWTAAVDGQPAGIAPGVFRAVQLQEGSHRIEFRYVPPGFQAGLRLFVVGLAGMLFLLGVLLGLNPRSVRPVGSLAGFGSV